jgi:hypothetical protein
MFVVEAALGNPHVALSPHGFTATPRGTHCIFGKGGSHVAHNEWVLFDTEQVMLRYLLEFTA